MKGRVERRFELLQVVLAAGTAGKPPEHHRVAAEYGGYKILGSGHPLHTVDIGGDGLAGCVPGNAEGMPLAVFNIIIAADGLNRAGDIIGGKMIEIAVQLYRDVIKGGVIIRGCILIGVECNAWPRSITAGGRTPMW